VLRGFKAGEQAALTAVYREHAPDVALLLRRGFSFTVREGGRERGHRFVGYGSSFELHDALHETFRRAFEPRARAAYDGLRPYGPYLRTIARNVVLRTFRSREVAFPEVFGEGDEGVPLGAPLGGTPHAPDARLEAAQVRELVARFLAGLAPGDRRLLELRFMEGMSQRDAADQLGLGRQRIRTRELKLREQLLAFMERHGEGTWVQELGARLGAVLPAAIVLTGGGRGGWSALAGGGWPLAALALLAPVGSDGPRGGLEGGARACSIVGVRHDR
jgi:RNA polymerase sigma-70 factor (ECF subfamily)